MTILVYMLKQDNDGRAPPGPGPAGQVTLNLRHRRRDLDAGLAGRPRAWAGPDARPNRYEPGERPAGRVGSGRVTRPSIRRSSSQYPIIARRAAAARTLIIGMLRCGRRCGADAPLNHRYTNIEIEERRGSDVERNTTRAGAAPAAVSDWLPRAASAADWLTAAAAAPGRAQHINDTELPTVKLESCTQKATAKAKWIDCIRRQESLSRSHAAAVPM